jgi:hypothetical protein
MLKKKILEIEAQLKFALKLYLLLATLDLTFVGHFFLRSFYFIFNSLNDDLSLHNS